jgi:hypothetical protein
MAPLSPLHVPGCARLGIARLKAFRLNVYEPLTSAVINGVDRSGNLRIEGAAIQHVLNDQPDTASFRAHGFAPVAGQRLEVYQGDTSVQHQLFGGRILETTVLYESRPQNVAYDLRCIDPTWLLNRQRVLASYVNQSATAIVLDLVARFTRGVTTLNVVAGLPVIDAITFTNEEPAVCLTALCQRIAASWYLDYGGDLHVFLSETETAGAITEAEPRTSADHALAEDLSQVVTKVIGRGGGVAAAIDLPAGSTELPVDEGDTAASWYAPTGGLVEVGTQLVTYAGVRGHGAVGALVGEAQAPAAAPRVTLMSSSALGAALPLGTYGYAVTFANATGETKPGPTASVAITGATAPTLFKTSVRPGYYADYQGKTTGGLYSWRIALKYVGGGWALGPPTDPVIANDRRYEIYVGSGWNDLTTGHRYYTGLMSGTVAPIEATYLYRTTDGGAVWYQERVFSGVAATSGWLDTPNEMTDADLLLENQPYPTGPIALFTAASVDQIPELPAAGFTSRKLYRTPVGSAQLKLRATNPTPPVYDVAADATLGANAPTSDTSGVTAPTTNPTVAAGATAIPVTDTGPFTADGGAASGWARIGDLTIRYSGIGTAQLTGLPAAGVGSLTTAVRHGAVILVQPRLTGIPAGGVGAITQGIPKGETVTIRVERQDDAAALDLAHRFGFSSQLEGIVEEVFSDSRMTIAELTDYLEALLLDRKDPRQTVTFTSRDPSLQVGRTVTITLTTPPISGTFRIQRVTFSEIAITGGLNRVLPLRRVEATNKLFTFTELLRALRGREGGVP